MTPNCNYSILPLYFADTPSKAIEWQHRNIFIYGCDRPILTHRRQIPPFIMTVPSQSVYKFSLVNAKTHNEVSSFTSDDLISTGFVVTPKNRTDYVSYASYAPIFDGTLPKVIGDYYIVITLDNGCMVSDVFRFVADTTDLLTIEWFADDDLSFFGGVIPYHKGYKNRLHLNAMISKPEYEFEEEGESRDGFFFVEKQISRKMFRFSLFAPEYLCDIMRTIRMATDISITQSGRRYDVNEFEMGAPVWTNSGNLASVLCKFSSDTIIKAIGVGQYAKGKGDFNDDFNNDFK